MTIDYDELLKRADEAIAFATSCGVEMDREANVYGVVRDQSAAIRSLQANLDAVKQRPIEDSPTTCERYYQRRNNAA